MVSPFGGISIYPEPLSDQILFPSLSLIYFFFILSLNPVSSMAGRAPPSADLPAIVASYKRMKTLRVFARRRRPRRMF
jgi:hypothetical protein